eukprot:TRINITY_DN1210_c0_g2_i1.p1 TRINITY_DN1210_c0_g2~~TRINITY_DN1210_c0_g2_i1.p1  ORF type:complete len:384 (-),score=84.75 TRINITY_DN1210_c0_g2_i1:45-1103(-)
MKVLFAVVLLIASLVCASGIAATFNQRLQVNSTATSYTFFTNPLGYGFELLVSSANANANSAAVVSNWASLPIFLPSGAIAANGGLPVGYINLGVLPTGVGAAIAVNFTAELEGNVNARLYFPPSLIASVNASILANIRPLWFNASTNQYYEVPTNQFNISSTGGIVIYTSNSINIVLAIRSPIPIAISIANNAVIAANIVANIAASFAVNEGTRAALYIWNLTASAGTVSISLSANSQAGSNAVAANNVLVSNIYTFNHSAGANANVNANLQYDISQSGRTYNATIVANAAWYTWTNGAWVRQSSSVNGNVVVYNTNHFSDWSVQSNTNGAGGAGSTLEIPMFAKLFNLLF